MLFRSKGPFVIRYPRGVGSNEDWRQPFSEIDTGKGRCLRRGKKVAVLTLGPLGVKVARVCKELAQQGIEVGHYDVRFVKPLDEQMLHEVFSSYTTVLTIEDGAIAGGMGSAILEFMSENGYQCKVKRLGIPDRFVEHGSQMALYKEIGLDMESIRGLIEELAKE